MSSGPCGPPKAMTRTASNGLDTDDPSAIILAYRTAARRDRANRRCDPPRLARRLSRSDHGRRWSSSTIPATGATSTRRCCTPSGTAGRRPTSSFPFFLFIVGVSITLSRKTASWGTILRRAAIIFALGLFLAGYPRFDLTRWRIPGVLQRIALCYLFAAAASYRARPPAIAAGRPDRARHARRAVARARLLGVMMLVPAPGGFAGDLSPEGNLGAWIDRALMAGHLWKPRWDPEGLLSTMPGDRHHAARDRRRPLPRRRRCARPQGRGAAGRRRRRRSRRLLWSTVVPDQQEPLDQFLRDLHRRLRLAAARDLLLGDRREGLARAGRSRS